MRARRQLSLLLALAVAGPLAAAEVWRWTDEKGEVRYGQVPPPGVSAQRLKIPSRSTDPVGVAKELTELEVRSRTNSLTAEARAQEAREAEAKAAAREQACAAAMKRYDELLATRFIIVEGKQGEEQYLTGDDAEARKEAARKKVEELCAD